MVAGNKGRIIDGNTIFPGGKRLNDKSLRKIDFTDNGRIVIRIILVLLGLFVFGNAAVLQCLLLYEALNNVGLQAEEDQ
ncbi:hypothetical protein D9M68_680130 [compost metagenome]